MSIRINGKKYINGTVVRANPVEEVTGTLEKIGIGSDVYEIQGSGGGSVYDVNDYYLQNGQISDGGNRRFLTAYYDNPLVSGKNYLINFKNSVDGSVVGTSLFKYTSDFTTTMTGGGSIGTITMIITSTSITSNNYSGSWQNIYVDVYREISSADFYHPVIYSTEEREIGVWTDNKPLYQKTFNGTWQLNGTSWSGTLVNVPNAELKNTECLGSDWQSMGVNGNIDSNGNLTLYNLRSTALTAIAITIQYTKTTDVAGSGTYNTLEVPTVHYTTDEKVIGTWIDGKPLYRRTFYYDNQSGLSSGDNKIIQLDSAINVTKLDGFLVAPDNNKRWILPYSKGSSTTAVIITDDHYINLYVNSDSWASTRKVYITIEYTKTTDQ